MLAGFKEKIGIRDREKVQFFFLQVLVFILPLYQKISTLVLVSLAAFSFFQIIRKKEFDIKRYSLPILLYVTIAFSFIYTENVESKYLEQRASLLAIPLIFATINIGSVNFRKLLQNFVWGCLIAVVFCYINALYNSISYLDGKLIFQPVVNEEFSFFYAVVRDGNYFFASFFSIFHDTIYFGIYLNTAIAIILSESLWKKSKWYFVILLLFSLAIFQLSSKIGIVTCFLIFVLYLWFRIKKISLKIGSVFLVLLAGILFFTANPRGKVMFDKISKQGITIDPSERFGYKLRLMSWDSALELIKENPVKGIGISDTQIELNKKYLSKNYSTPLKQNLNAHNTFLQAYLESGVLGLLIIMIILYNIVNVVRHNDRTFFGMSFFIIVFLSFLFESVLNRYSGISFFVMFYCMILNYSYKNRNMQK